MPRSRFLLRTYNIHGYDFRAVPANFSSFQKWSPRTLHKSYRSVPELTRRRRDWRDLTFLLTTRYSDDLAPCQGAAIAEDSAERQAMQSAAVQSQRAWVQWCCTAQPSAGLVVADALCTVLSLHHADREMTPRCASQESMLSFEENKITTCSDQINE